MKKIILLHSFLLFSGFLFGLAAYFCLPEEQILALQQYLTVQMQDLSATATLAETAGRVFRSNAMDFVRVYLAGICLLGVPLILLFLFLKGFTFGFVACFLLAHSPLLLLSRLLYFPSLIAVAVLGCRFSLMLVQNRASSPLRQLLQYTVGFAFLLVLVLLLSCIDGFSSYHYLHRLLG